MRPTDSLTLIIDDVLHFLDTRRRLAAEHLFPGSEDHQVAYRQEWIDRTPLAFWFHLDHRGRRELVKAATDFYGTFRAGEAS